MEPWGFSPGVHRLIEHEIKLRFESADAARQAVITAGGRSVVPRRLLVDTLLDSGDQRLRDAGCGLRIRREPARAIITFKGPVQGGAVKSREEIETTVENADDAQQIFERLGYRRWFRGEKYREEYALGDTHVAIDESPIGVFVEIEGDPL